jgi:hypothetical protein
MPNLETIDNKIVMLRDQKVMFDFDLALLYEIETKRLKEAVRRNIERFPEDFMFELTKEEFDNLRTQFATSSYGGTRYMPFAFTEQGVAMLSSVLKSQKAIEVNIAIMRTFVMLRNSILSFEEVSKRITEVEKQFPEIYNALNYLMETDKKSIEQTERSTIGYKKI